MNDSVLGVSVSVGVIRSEHELEMSEEMPAGLKLGLIMDGDLGLVVEGRPGFSLSGPAQCLLVSHDGFEMMHSLHGQRGVSYVTIVLDAMTRDDLLGKDAGRLQAAMTHGRGVGVHYGRAGAAACAIARQINACPFQGGIRQTYVTAKALEVVATVAGAVLDSEWHVPGLRVTEIGKLMEVRHILSQSSAKPPSLTSLAKQVGLNVRRLTDGFRSHFGSTIAEFIAEQRLQEGYRLLSSGEMGVAQVAYRIGYTPNHFSMAFRNRFGLSPSQVKYPLSSKKS